MGSLVDLMHIFCSTYGRQGSEKPPHVRPVCLFPMEEVKEGMGERGARGSLASVYIHSCKGGWGGRRDM